MSFSLILAGKPVSKKNSWSFGRGHMFMTKEARAYGQAVKLQAACQMRIQRAPKIVAPALVAVRARVYFTKLQRMDVHNAMETVLDALQDVAYDNDRQVVGHFHPPTRYIDNVAPRVELEIQTAAETAGDMRWA